MIYQIDRTDKIDKIDRCLAAHTHKSIHHCRSSTKIKRAILAWELSELQRRPRCCLHSSMAGVRWQQSFLLWAFSFWVKQLRSDQPLLSNDVQWCPSDSPAVANERVFPSEEYETEGVKLKMHAELFDLKMLLTALPPLSRARFYVRTLLRAENS